MVLHAEQDTEVTACNTGIGAIVALSQAPDGTLTLTRYESSLRVAHHWTCTVMTQHPTAVQGGLVTKAHLSTAPGSNMVVCGLQLGDKWNLQIFDSYALTAESHGLVSKHGPFLG